MLILLATIVAITDLVSGEVVFSGKSPFAEVGAVDNNQELTLRLR